ncbi:hypothetical protein COO60DRAFT_1535233 [Scenedesmus sp. NREL 46B-D3]|nr:hypothetical protein COO60DRAFT_1535233 [Scenedesmus sp. NREL 46B-D3]
MLPILKLAGPAAASLNHTAATSPGLAAVSAAVGLRLAAAGLRVPAADWPTSTACCCHFHSSSCSANDEADVEQPVASSNDSSEDAGAAAPAGDGSSSSSSGARARARHISLDDPELNIYLKHNTGFVTDPDRSYALGHRRAFDRLTRQELRKALAAQRLFLRDEVAALAAGPAGDKQLPMRKQMLARMSEIQDAAAASR